MGNFEISNLRLLLDGIQKFLQNQILILYSKIFVKKLFLDLMSFLEKIFCKFSLLISFLFLKIYKFRLISSNFEKIQLYPELINPNLISFKKILEISPVWLKKIFSEKSLIEDFSTLGKKEKTSCHLNRHHF